MWIRTLLGGLWKRLLLVAIASLVIVYLAHVETGRHPQSLAGAQVDAWFADAWLENSHTYLQGLLHGELGTMAPLGAGASGLNQAMEMTQVLRTFGPNSLWLLLAALAITLVLGTAAGLLSSRLGARWFRLPAISTAILLVSMPDILIIMLLRMLLVAVMSAYGVKLFSFSSFGGALTASHFIAPVLALSALPLGMVARLSAVAFDEVADQLYIRTAVAKGLRPWKVIFRHALKNAWIRVAESSPAILSALVGGLVVVEYVLYFPGVGRVLALSLERGGQGAALSALSIAFLLLAMLVDLIFSAIRLRLDPRLAERQAAHRSDWVAGPSRGGTDLRAVWKEVRSVTAEWPERMRSWLWRNRPSRLFRQVGQNPILLVGLIGVGLLLCTALFGVQVLDLTDRQQMVRYVVKDETIQSPPYAPGTPGFPLGSDVAGRSVLSMLLIGARYTIFFALAVTPVRFLVALPWGLYAGLRRGWWAASSRTTGLLFSALPVILIPAMLLSIRRAVSPIWESNQEFWIITAILAVSGIPRLAESIRLHVEAVAVQPFLEGARAAGASNGRILWRHIFPHLMPQLWVSAATDMAWTLLLLAQFGVLSIYLGGSFTVATGLEIFGTSTMVTLPRLMDWSSLLSKPNDVIYQAPWAFWYPALAFFLAVASFNLVAEGLRRSAQRMTALLTADDAPDDQPARRRLALEWGSVGVLALVLVTFITRTVSQNQQFYGAARGQPTLEQARIQMQGVLRLAADGYRQETARGLIDGAVSRYLLHAFKAGMTAEQIEEHASPNLKLWKQDHFMVASVVVRKQGKGEPQVADAYLVVVDENAGRISSARSPLVPTSLAVIRRDPTERWLMAAGPAIGEERPTVAVWAGPGKPFRSGSFVQWRTTPVGEVLARSMPQQFEADMKAEGRPAVARDGVHEVRVERSGDLTLCTEGTGPCRTFRWEDGHWEIQS